MNFVKNTIYGNNYYIIDFEEIYFLYKFKDFKVKLIHKNQTQMQMNQKLLGVLVF
jgi:hypothetical protein